MAQKQIIYKLTGERIPAVNGIGLVVDTWWIIHSSASLIRHIPRRFDKLDHAVLF